MSENGYIEIRQKGESELFTVSCQVCPAYGSNGWGKTLSTAKRGVRKHMRSKRHQEAVSAV